MLKSSVSYHTLDNGLSVLIQEQHSNPIVAMQIWMKVGSNNETNSIAGVSHFIEHLLFTGTEKRKAGEVSFDIAKVGGYINAFTSYEETVYWLTIPSDHYADGLDVLFDMVMNSVFESEQIEKERKVVIEEIKMRNDNPSRRTFKTLMATAFKKHRFGRSVIGFDNVIANISRDEIVAYYKNYYVPNNATVVVVGDINTSEVLNTIKEYSAEWKEKDVDFDISQPEPPQHEPRFCYIDGDIKQNYIGLAFHIPDILHRDRYALEVLDQILAGGRSSRIYQRVKEDKGIINNYQSSLLLHREPDTWILHASQSTEQSPVEAQAAIMTEIEKIKSEAISTKELDRAKTYLESQYMYLLEHASDIAELLGRYHLVGYYQMIFDYPDKIRNVTIDDVKLAAENYLNINNCSFVHYLPTNTSQKIYKPTELFQDINIMVKKELGTKPMIQGWKLDNGMRVLIKENFSSPTIAFVIMAGVGSAYETVENNSISNLTLTIMTKGTKTRTNEDVATELDSFGSSMSFSASAEYSTLNFKCISKHFEETLEVASDLILNPTFQIEWVEKEKARQKAIILKAKDDTYGYSLDLFYKALYGNQRYGLTSNGSIESVEAITRDKLIQWHNEYYVPENLVMCIVGAIDSQIALNRVRALFESWEPAKMGKSPLENFSFTKTSKSEIIEEGDKNQTVITLGFLAPSALSDYKHQMKVLDYALGKDMSARLFRNLRDKKGLAYLVRSNYLPMKHTGVFYTHIGTSPNQENIAKDGLIDEMNKIKKDGITDEEFKKVKSYIYGAMKIADESRFFQAFKYAHSEILGTGYRSVDEELEKINKVTMDEIRESAQKHFDLENYAVGILRGKS